MLRQPKTLKVNKKTQSSQKHKKHAIAKKQTKRNIQTLVDTKRIANRTTKRPAFNKTLKNINSNDNNTFASLMINNQESSFFQQPTTTPATMMQQNKSFFSTTSFAPTRHTHYAAFQKSRALFNDNKEKQQAENNDAIQNTEQQQETGDETSSKTGRKQYKSNRPKVESATFMQRCKTALSKQTYESPISKAIKDLPPLGDTAYLTEDNEEWELVYKTGLRNSLYYVKKMSITSFLGGTLAVPFIFLSPFAVSDRPSCISSRLLSFWCWYNYCDKCLLFCSNYTSVY
eukprot:UN03611